MSALREPPVSTPGLFDLVEVRFALLWGASFLLVTTCHAVDLGVTPATALLALGLVLACVDLPLAWAVAAGACGWALLTGFVVNHGGQLSLGAHDAARLATLVVTAALTARLGRRRTADVTTGCVPQWPHGH